MKNEEKAYVYLSFQGDNLLVGMAYNSFVAGKETPSFSFDESYFHWPFAAAFFLDPDLSFFPGRQFLTSSKETFGFLSDSSPDRWGRLLLQRQEIALAKKEGRRPRTLDAFDYLLGVNDEARMGALRFKKEPNGPFLALPSHDSIPPMTSLRELESISRAFESNETISDERLRRLVVPGSSLGGARPKASVKAPDGSLWLAKFPSRQDSYPVASFEMVAHDLASLCGIRVAEARLGSFSRFGKTFLSKRFDRLGEERIPFASALALTGKTDGKEAGYLDLASLLKAKGSRPKEDLRELFRRLLFNIAIANTDDHLRNHGFLLEKNGWRLAPAFDMNPNPDKNYLTLSVDGVSHELDFAAALAVAPVFGYQPGEAKELKGAIVKTIADNYGKLAKRYGIRDEDASRMSLFFHLD